MARRAGIFRKHPSPPSLKFMSEAFKLSLEEERMKDRQCRELKFLFYSIGFRSYLRTMELGWNIESFENFYLKIN